MSNPSEASIAHLEEDSRRVSDDRAFPDRHTGGVW